MSSKKLFLFKIRLVIKVIHADVFLALTSDTRVHAYLVSVQMFQIIINTRIRVRHFNVSGCSCTSIRKYSILKFFIDLL